MKKILFVALAATLLAAGCQKTEIINSVNPNGTPSMTFSTEIAKLTKSAIANGTANLQAQGFVLSAVCAYEDIYTTGETEFNSYYDELDNTAFSYKDEKWSISTEESYFWPGKGRDLVFFAISSSQKATDVQMYKVPTIVANGFGITGETSDENGLCESVTVSNYVIQDYTVVKPTYIKEAAENVEVGDQTGADDDLMVADVVIQDQDETPLYGEKNRVDLFFNHTLSKVEFVFSTNEGTENTYPVVVKSVTVEDVVKTADLTITVDLTNRISNNIYDWNADDAQKTYAVADNANAETYTIDYDLSLTSGEKPYATWLVIPQSLENKMVSITYTIGDGSGKEPKEFTSVWPLYAEGLDAWNINQYVRYKVNLSPNLITFNPVVEKEWEEPKSVNPSTDETPVTPTYTEFQAGDITLYYKGTLEVGTVVYKKDNETYVKADAGTYGKYTIDAEGKITEIAE